MKIAIPVLSFLWVGFFLLFESSRIHSHEQGSRPQRPSSSPASARSDFVGAEACSECHRTQYDAWRLSTHARAGGKPDAAHVIAPFDETPLRFRDATVIPTITKNGDYVFIVRQEGRQEKLFRVDGVIGGGHMMGGGTQGFVSRFADGTYRFLPFDYSKDEKRWFTNTSTRAQKGWVPITESLRLADSGDWPPNRILGNEPRFSNCQECHGSQIEVRWDAQSKRYETRFTTLSINCESCHGPARRHVELARSQRLGKDIGLRSLSLLDKDASLLVCFQCHAVKDALRQGYLPGKDLQEYYSIKLPLLGEPQLHPDGRVRTFAYQENHLFSDCYLNGSMTCVSCHDPHSQGYRDIYENPLPDRFDDRQCTGCHASKADDISLHTYHAPDSPGSRCVTCHMPYLQHPEIGHAIRFSRSDHSIAIPRPLFDSSLGIVNACSTCHSTASVDSLDRTIARWYGTLKPHKPIVSALVKAGQIASVREIADLVLLPSANHPMAQVAGLALVVERLPESGADLLLASALDSLKALAMNPDIDVRALALTAHILMGASVQQPMDEQIRRRIALTLGYRADKHMQQGNPDRALELYEKAVQFDSTNGWLHLNTGRAHAARGNYQEAIRSYRVAQELDPTNTLVLVNLGLAYAAQGNLPRAIATYERAIELNPQEVLAYFNLANIYLEARQYQRAIPLYQKAVDLDPSLTLGHLYLARSLLLTGQLESALGSVQRALEFDPDNASAQEMERDLRRALKKD